MNYFNIQPVTINTSPFESIEINSVRWYITSYYRDGDYATCQCMVDSIDGSKTHLWLIQIPKNTLDQWLDDSVIDDYICDISNGLFVKV